MGMVLFVVLLAQVTQIMYDFPTPINWKLGVTKLPNGNAAD